MNYEKKYLEALEKARQFSEHPLEEDSSSIVEYIFPELKESEDEKIRKWLIEWAKAVNWSEQFTVTKEQVLAWLEKQGKRDARYENLEELLEADTIYQMAMNDAMVEEAKTKAMNALSELEIGKLLEIVKQGEQHSPIDINKMVDDFSHTEVKGYGIPSMIEVDAYRKGIEDTLEKQGEQKTINQPDFEIPFGAKDSELIEESYYIPKGYHAEISKDKVTIKKGEQEPIEFKWSADDKNKLLIIEQILNCANLLISSQELTAIKNWLKSLKQRIGE